MSLRRARDSDRRDPVHLRAPEWSFPLRHPRWRSRPSRTSAPCQLAVAAHRLQSCRACTTHPLPATGDPRGWPDTQTLSPRKMVAGRSSRPTGRVRLICPRHTAKLRRSHVLARTADSCTDAEAEQNWRWPTSALTASSTLRTVSGPGPDRRARHDRERIRRMHRNQSPQPIRRRLASAALWAGLSCRGGGGRRVGAKVASLVGQPARRAATRLASEANGGPRVVYSCRQARTRVEKLAILGGGRGGRVLSLSGWAWGQRHRAGRAPKAEGAPGLIRDLQAGRLRAFCLGLGGWAPGERARPQPTLPPPPFRNQAGRDDRAALLARCCRRCSEAQARSCHQPQNAPACLPSLGLCRTATRRPLLMRLPTHAGLMAIHGWRSMLLYGLHSMRATSKR